MSSNWPVLKTPPIITAVFQLKFDRIESENLSVMIANDKEIRTIYPKRIDNFSSEINVHGTPVPGISTLKARADTRIKSYIYQTVDKKSQLVIEQDSVIIIDENQYSGWEVFKGNILKSLVLLKDQLASRLTTRISIRFVNKFCFNNFDDPLEFFTKLISTDSEFIYPIINYTFKFSTKIPESNKRAIINNALEPNGDKIFDYYLDIDVLDDTEQSFDLTRISEHLESLREIKNKLFFDSIQQKTIDLCN